MSALRAVIQRPQPQRFLRKTSLLGSESNTNFKMLDNDIGEAITSEEADRVTPLMSKIYTRLLLTPPGLREGARTLRFTGEEKEDGAWMTAWVQLCRHLRVSSETASKALTWMHGQGIIGYFAGKNGVGIRIFLNRAATSITVRQCPPGQKNSLRAHASVHQTHTSAGEPPFNDSFAEEEILETDLNPPAPKNGAQAKPIAENSCDPPTAPTNNFQNNSPPDRRVVPGINSNPGKFDASVPVNEIIWQLRSVLEPTLKSVAIQAAQREHERTREWLESSGIPKAVRVAQRESYGVLRAYGLIEAKKGGAKFKDDVGRSFHSREGLSAGVADTDTAATASQSRTCLQKKLSEAEVLDLAEACVALFKAQGKPINVTMLEMTGRRKNRSDTRNTNSSGGSVDGGKGKGGWLSAADAERVSALAHELMDGET